MSGQVKPSERTGIFKRRLFPFTNPSLKQVPPAPGVYIIYNNKGEPFYIGRSRISVHARLRRHLHGLGNRKIAAALQQGLTFEFEIMVSVEQAEAVLIREMGSYRYGNLRRETDPADWT